MTRTRPTIEQLASVRRRLNALCLGAVLGLAPAACTAPAEHLLRLTAADLPEEARELEIWPVFDGRTLASVLRERLADPAGARTDVSLLLNIPEGQGALRLYVAALGDTGCPVALGESSLLGAYAGADLALRLKRVDAGVGRCPRGAPILLSAAIKDAVVPTAVSSQGQQELVLQGYGFRPRAAVSVGEARAPSVTWRSPLSLVARTPARPGKTGAVDITVENPPSDGAEGTRALAPGALRGYLGQVAFAPDLIVSPLPAEYRGSVSRFADVNGDRRPDFIGMGPPTDPQLLIALGGADGRFVLQPPLPLLPGGQLFPAGTTAVGDVDGDHLPDLAMLVEARQVPGVGANQGKRLLLLRSDPSAPGRFRSPRLYLTEAGLQLTPFGLDIGDMNHDGLGDIAMVSGGIFIKVLFGQAGAAPAVTSGYDATSVRVDLQPGPTSLRLSDLDEDGNLDMVLDSSNTERTYIVRGLSGGRFLLAADSLPLLGIGQNTLLVDLDQDRRLDLLVSETNRGPGPHQLMVLRGRGKGLFDPVVGTRLPYWLVTMEVGDVNLDGAPDIVGRTTYDGASPRLASVLLNDGRGAFPQAAWREGIPTGDGPALFDVNGDGRADLVSEGDCVAGSTAYHLCVRLNLSQ